MQQAAKEWRGDRLGLGLALAALGLSASACSVAPLPANGTQQGACCGGLGLCLPASFLDSKQAQLLGQESCGEATMCVPNELRGRNTPKSCTVSSTGAEGRCLPQCLPSITARGAQLAQDGCEAHQRCVPCYDPITGASTDACAVGEDRGPLEPPNVFAPCCGEIGRCVPRTLVPSAQQSLLGRDSCDEESALCAPLDALLKGDAYLPERCTTLGTASEGRCLPACLPSLAGQRERLGQTSCSDGFLCAPCSDPISGKATGACTLGSDPGPQSSERTLEACCGSAGHCVPPELLSAEERKQVGPDSCHESGRLCVPDAFAAPDFRPASCTLSDFDAEGRCLPDCLPSIAAQRNRLKRESCGAGMLCAPCVDPATGDATGACTLGSDKGATRPPVTFASCCGGAARCVPKSAVPEAQRAQLAKDSCRGADSLCVPNELVTDPGFVPSQCVVSALQAEGRCLSECLGAVAARPGVFKRDGCGAQQVCVPCQDPVTGQATGACGFGADPGPRAPAPLLAPCCGGLGRCAPKALVPEAQAANFGPDACAPAADALCVAPSAALSDPAFVPPSCEDALTHAEGRCLPKCLPAVASRASALSSSGCPAEHVCAPCFDPTNGQATGACSSPADPGPQKPAVVFQACCGASPSTATGMCVPKSLLPSGAPELPKQDCAGELTVCAPRVLVNDAKAALPKCTSASTSSGVCIEQCYLDSLARLVSFAGDCKTGSLCVACSLLGGIGGCPAQ